MCYPYGIFFFNKDKVPSLIVAENTPPGRSVDLSRLIKVRIT